MSGGARRVTLGTGGADGPVEVVNAGVTLGDDGVTYPTVVLDAADRPDITDLPRVHALEGIGDLTTSAVRTRAGVDLTIELSRPVVARFTVRFRLPDHRVVLADAASTGTLLLATSAPAGAVEHPAWLAVDLDGPSLRSVIEQPAP